jgi:hypothetical protein
MSTYFSNSKSIFFCRSPISKRENAHREISATPCLLPPRPALYHHTNEIGSNCANQGDRYWIQVPGILRCHLAYLNFFLIIRIMIRITATSASVNMALNTILRYNGAGKLHDHIEFAGVGQGVPGSLQQLVYFRQGQL